MVEAARVMRKVSLDKSRLNEILCSYLAPPEPPEYDGIPRNRFEGVRITKHGILIYGNIGTTEGGTQVYGLIGKIIPDAENSGALSLQVFQYNDYKLGTQRKLLNRLRKFTLKSETAPSRS